MDEAESLVEEMRRRGVVVNEWTLNALLRGWARLGEAEEARRVFATFLESGFTPDAYTFGMLMSCFRNAGLHSHVSVSRNATHRIDTMQNDPFLCLRCSSVLALFCSSLLQAWEVLEMPQSDAKRKDIELILVLLLPCSVWLSSGFFQVWEA